MITPVRGRQVTSRMRSCGHLGIKRKKDIPFFFFAYIIKVSISVLGVRVERTKPRLFSDA